MINIFFSEVTSANRYDVFLPYAWGLLRNYCDDRIENPEQLNWVTPFFRPESIGSALNRISIEPHIFGFSCYIWNWRFQVELARKVKNKFPKCLIVFGGPQVPKNDLDFFTKYPFVDLLVHGEGEKSFFDIIKSYKSDKDWSQVLGISFQVDGRRVDTEPKQRIDLSVIEKGPYQKEYFKEIISRLKDEKVFWNAILESNRGCPYGCLFCDWGSATKSKINSYRTEVILREVEYLAIQNVNVIGVSDANFGLFERDIEIAKHVTALKSQYNAPKYFMPQMSKGWGAHNEAVAQILNDSDLTIGITLSLQSWNEKTLAAIKRKNVSQDQYSTVAKMAKLKNIPIYTELILGLPEESYSSYLSNLNKILLNQVDELRVYPLTMLPNADLSDKSCREKYKLKTQMIPFNNVISEQELIEEMMEVVIENSTFSEAEMQMAWVFTFMAQSFFTAHWLRYISIYLNREHSISYLDFYGVFLKLNDHQFPIVTKIIELFFKLSRSFKVWDFYKVDGKSIYLSPVGLASLHIEENREFFYLEIKKIVELQFGIELLDDLLLFQNHCLVSSGFDVNAGVSYSYEYDWVAYFEKTEKLKKERISISYSDQYFGINKLKFARNNRHDWLKKIVGLNYSYLSLHHQKKFRVIF
jgi:putative methyltransferase